MLDGLQFRQVLLFPTLVIVKRCGRGGNARSYGIPDGQFVYYA